MGHTVMKAGVEHALARSGSDIAFFNNQVGVARIKAPVVLMVAKTKANQMAVVGWNNVVNILVGYRRLVKNIAGLKSKCLRQGVFCTELKAPSVFPVFYRLLSAKQGVKFKS